jgi:hypothetical protein
MRGIDDTQDAINVLTTLNLGGATAPNNDF